MSHLLTVAEVIAAHALRTPNKPATRDSTRTLTFREWDERANRLANALLGLGLSPGDRVAILAFNCVEWMELYVAAAKAGLVAVPVNFRLAPPEVAHVLADSGARAFVVAGEFFGVMEQVRREVPIPAGNYIAMRAPNQPAGVRDYETLIAQGSPKAPESRVDPASAWTIMYTSGTTGKPKGAVRSHESYALFYLLNAVEFGFSPGDGGLSVMPMCHVNSVFYSFVFTYRGAMAAVYDQAHFDPAHLLRTVADWRTSFTSLVPTHYAMLLDLPAREKAAANVEAVRKLLISSAPATRELKLAVMDYFRNSELFEAYGSTEAGLVTLLRPEEQFEHLGSIGREIVGTGRIRLLGEDGREVPDGEVGELYSRTPTAFTEYWNLPPQTAGAFRDGYCTVGDMARRDAEGFYTLVDRKHNMIITGGENVFPSEVEAVLRTHPDVSDAAVVGVPDATWGERVTAVVVPMPGRAFDANAIADFCRGKIANFKRPRAVLAIAPDEMPRSATGKILHRVLRDRLAAREAATVAGAHGALPADSPSPSPSNSTCREQPMTATTETTTIKSWVMTAVGQPFEAAERTVENVPDGEALIEVAGCGVCHTDISFWQVGVKTRGELPLTLGHEISGRVRAVGAGVSADWVGKAVVVPAVLPCGTCERCRAGQRRICANQIMPGNDRHGGFASHVVVPAMFLCAVPDSVMKSHELWQLAVVADALTTPFQAVQRAGVSAGDLAIFVGVGGVGVHGVQIAKAVGARVVALDIDDAKLETAKLAGADAAINVRELAVKDVRKAVAAEAKALSAPDFGWKIFETSGTRPGQETAFNLLTHGATLGIVGFTMDKLDTRLSNLMAFDAQAFGNWGCDPMLYPEVLNWLGAGRIQLTPHVEAHSLAEINAIFTAAHHGDLRRRAVLIP